MVVSMRPTRSQLEDTNKRLSACLICALAIMRKENGAEQGIRVFLSDEEELVRKYTVVLELVAEKGYYQAVLAAKPVTN